MIELDMNPGSGILLVSLVAVIVLGFMTLTGTFALAIWIVFALVAAAVVYGLGKRIAARLRGDRPMASRRGGDW